MSNNNKVKRMSPDSRTKLVGLVNKTAEYVAEGLHPTDALVKAAGEGEYPPDYIQRAAEAYNGAAHLQHFKEAAYDSRGDTFDLADSCGALVELFGSRTVPTKDAQYVDLSTDDRRYFNTCGDVEVQKSAAASNTPRLTTKEAIDQCQRLDDIEFRGLDKAVEKLSALKDSLKNSLQHLNRAVAVEPNPQRINKMASEFLAGFGQDAVDIVLEATNFTEDEACKLAEFEGYAVVPDDDLYKAFKEALDAKLAAFTAEEQLATKEAEHYVNKLERNSLVYSLLGIKKAAEIRSFEGFPTVEEGNLNDIPFVCKKVGSFTMKSILTGNAIGQLMTGEEGDPFTSDGPDGYTRGIQGLLDPAFLEESKKIDLATKMHDILKDPVIARYSNEPQKVQEALYELMALAPTAVNYKPLLRSMLRQRLESEGRIDPHELGTLLSQDTALRSRTQNIEAS